MRIAFAGLLLLALWACGGGDPGDACDTPGATDECADGVICTNDSEGVVCREICNDHPDCPGGFKCNGVSGSNIKSCQPE